MNAWRWIAAGVGACVLVSCGGGRDDTSPDNEVTIRGAGNTFTVTNLVADTACAANVDPNLVNGWGHCVQPAGLRVGG
ncbi:MAG TPA: hypothetical protein VFU71_19460 [Burkholderiaceae bacterium]|nr:hypothetical protein [Burkholderiaceae bacterium]